ncbi:SUMF1/EgtB/PvdO family nonheme iron enzyme, partial [Alkalilimnicola ehrlichii]|uniref:formylglycine-generating enzyme family protein n=1 Tax=Alkalilimnicola ehrlichii TaxID=351052 RepID=UPI0015F28522
IDPENLSPELQAHVDRTLESLVFVEGGTFMMGDVGFERTLSDGTVINRRWTGDRDTHPAHEVTLDSYSIQRYEVVHEEYDLFTRSTGRELVRANRLHMPTRGPDLPAWGMDWYDARAYCHWLGELTGLPFDLPTEAQWEYAARSRGKNVPYATDDGTIDRGRNYRGPDTPSGATPPRTFPPNPLGLYGMIGNQPEWVLDWYGPYTEEPKHNPTGPEAGDRKVQRGSGWIGSPEMKMVFRRSPTPPDNTGGGGGIRCVVNQASPVSRD